MKNFKEPELEVSILETEDVITTSEQKDPDEMGGMPV